MQPEKRCPYYGVIPALLPRKEHDRKRLDDLTRVITICLANQSTVPAEWTEEYNELTSRMTKHGS
jgi:hypothetical protein